MSRRSTPQQASHLCVASRVRSPRPEGAAPRALGDPSSSSNLRRARLDRHHADRVRHDIVQLARDPQPLFGYRCLAPPPRAPSRAAASAPRGCDRSPRASRTVCAGEPARRPISSSREDHVSRTRLPEMCRHCLDACVLENEADHRRAGGRCRTPSASRPGSPIQDRQGQDAEPFPDEERARRHDRRRARGRAERNRRRVSSAHESLRSSSRPAGASSPARR